MIITQNKYIVVTEDKILAIKGFIRKNNINTNQIKLFNTPCQIKDWFSESRNYKRVSYEIKQVKVQIEVLDYE